jgi:GntR family transcriptional regulator, transcriptional repressor for pyruvate dehydrogenase complex
VFSSVRTPRVYEHIVEQIESAIFDGQLGCGDRLPPERALVRQFRASRVAVREALRTLEHRGLIDVRHGSSGGHFVRAVDAGLLRRDLTTLLRLSRVAVPQLTEARLFIEPEIARLAARRASDEDVKTLRSALEERADLVRAGGHPRPLDIGFHRLVGGVAKNPVHALMVDAVMGLEVDVVGPRIELTAEDNAEVAAAHREIFEAILKRQPELAGAVMEAHIVDVQRRLGRRESGGWRSDR